MNTLIVEDDVVSRCILQEILQEYGEVLAVVNGSEAIKIYHEQKFDLICLDINMPQMSGHEVLSYIRTHEQSIGLSPWEGVKIIITSILSDNTNVFNAFRGLADGYLTKPFELEKLVNYLVEFKLVHL